MTPSKEDPMTDSAQSPSPAPERRNRLLVGSVIALAVIAGLVLTFILTREPETASGDPSPSASPSGPASPSADPSPSEEPSAPASPSEEPVAAPGEWTQVHTIGDGSTRIVGGEIAWGDAGFLAVARQFEGSEGGPHVSGYSMWRSADGQSWAEVPYPAPDEGTYDVVALSGAADGSYVFHAYHFSGSATSLVSLRSTDGETWEPLETGLPSDLSIVAIEEGPAGYLLVGGQGAETNPTLWLSTDALTWELVHEFTQDQQFVQLHDGDGGAEGYVVIGRRIEHDSSSYERFAFASADGRHWVETAAPFGPDDQTYVWEVAVSSHGDGWLATLGRRDEATSLWSSADGLAWSETGSLDTPELSLSSAGLFEEVGDELILSPGATVTEFGTPGAWSSTDGTTWSPVDLGADAWLGELAIGDGVVAMTGTIPGSGETHHEYRRDLDPRLGLRSNRSNRCERTPGFQPGVLLSSVGRA